MSEKVIEFKKKDEGFKRTVDTGLTMYDANKQIMNQLIEQGEEHPLNPMEQAAIQKKIEDWFNMVCDNYAMLLCHERRDYTLFSMYRNSGNKNPPAMAAKEFMALINERGTVYSIEEEGQAWEIWIGIDKILYVYYLFRYDEGVIEV